MTGKGTTPDYVFHYLLSANGMAEGDLTLEFKSEAAEVAAVLKEQPDAIGLLPQPFVTAACMQNEALQIVLDLTKEWQAVQGEHGQPAGYRCYHRPQRLLIREPERRFPVLRGA